MASYSDLKSRVMGELVREDDLADGEEQADRLTDAIKGAIRYYQGRKWWFLTKTDTAATVADQNYIARPTDFAAIDRISIPALAAELKRVPLAEIEMLDEPAGQTGQPCLYAEDGDNVRIWPTPNAVYSLKLVGTEQFDELSGDDDENVWTNEACDLIAAHAKFILCRGVLRDPDGATMAQAEVTDAIAALDQQDLNRTDGPMCPGW